MKKSANSYSDQDLGELYAAKMLGLKLTKQREAITKVFFRAGGHRSAEEILSQAREVDARISLATIYRTMKILTDNGLAKAHRFKDGQALFEPNLHEGGRHDHLICTRCNTIIEFFNEEIERLQQMVADEHKFLVTSHRMELYGLCTICQKNPNTA